MGIKKDAKKIAYHLKKMAAANKDVFYSIDEYIQMKLEEFLELKKETGREIEIKNRDDWEYPYQLKIKYEGVEFITIIEGEKIPKLKQMGIWKEREGG